MSDPKPSAEKDLLKLIENPGAAQSQPVSGAPAAAAAKAPAKAASAKPHLKIPSLKNILSDSKLMIKALFSVAAVIFVYFIFNVFHEFSFLEKAKNVKNFEHAKTAESRVKSAQVPGLAESEEAGDDFSLRNVFKPFAKKKPEETQKDETTSKLQDLKLVGISIEPNPADSYAMIENTKTSVTFFVKKGETFLGMELFQIAEDKLLFKSGGQIVELR